MNYFMSDPHFGHKNILKFSRSEFETVLEHNEHIVDQVNNTVHPTKDKLFILGDIAFSSEYFWLASINCQNIVIILGNHDYPNKIASIQKFRSDAKLGGALGLTLKDGQNRIEAILTHIPVHPSQLKDKEGFGRYDVNIHGHLHQYSIENDPRYVNVSMEHLYNYKPISEHQLVQKINCQISENSV